MTQKKPFSLYAGEVEGLALGDTLPPTTLGTGTPDGTKFLRDDGVLASVSATINNTVTGTGVITFNDSAVAAVTQTIKNPVTKFMRLASAGAWQYGASDTTGNILVLIPSTSVSACMVSTDAGVTWTLISLPGTLTDAKIVFAAGKFLIYPLTTTSVIYYSTNGTTWQSVSFVVSFAVSHIAYGNNNFIAVGNASTTVGYSTDGTVWNTQLTTLPDVDSNADLIYGNGIFLKVSNDTNYVYTSITGLSWTKSATPVLGLGFSTFFAASARFLNNKFYVLVNTSAGLPTIQVSTNGLDWNTLYCEISSPYLSGLDYINGYFVCLMNIANTPVLQAGRDITLMSYLQDSTSIITSTGVFSNAIDRVFILNSTVRDSLHYVEIRNQTIPMPKIPVIAINQVNAESFYSIQPGIAQPKVGSTSATIVLTGLTTVLTTSNIRVWIDPTDSTSSHNASEHQFVPIDLKAVSLVNGIGFTVQARSRYRLTGSFAFRYKIG